jgi:Family of unknown function (DUF6437)
VAKKTVNALSALNKLIEEQKVLAERAEAARTAAALELGIVVLDAGGVALTAGQLKAAVEAAVAAAKTAPAKRQASPATGGENG